MMGLDRNIRIRILIISLSGVILSACNPATKGWSSVGGSDVSLSRLAAAKDNCGYRQARSKAIRLLKASGHRQKNEQHAAQLLNRAEQCMSRKYGIHYRSAGQR